MAHFAVTESFLQGQALNARSILWWLPRLALTVPHTPRSVAYRPVRGEGRRHLRRADRPVLRVEPQLITPSVTSTILITSDKSP